MTIIKKGAIDQSLYFKLVDSTAGTPKTGLTITNIDATYVRNISAAVKNDLTALAAVTTAHTDNKGIEVDSVNAPGLYRIDFPDAAFATGSDKVILSVTCAACDPAMKEIELVDNDSSDVYTRIGAPSGASIAADLVVIDDFLDTEISAIKAKTDSMTFTVAGMVDSNVIDWKGATAPAMTGDAFARLGAPAGASVSADIVAVKTETATILGDTNDIQTRIPAALVSGRIDASVGAMAANVMTAAAAAADLTTELQAGLSTLDAAGVRAAIGLAGANLDTQIATLATQALLTTVAGYIDTEVAAIFARIGAPAGASISADLAAVQAKTANLPVAPASTGDAMALTGAAVDAILDEVVEGSTTMRELLRGFSAALLNKVSGMATTTPAFRDIADTKNRITATVDADGNRSAVTLDLS